MRGKSGSRQADALGLKKESRRYQSELDQYRRKKEEFACAKAGGAPKPVLYQTPSGLAAAGSAVSRDAKPKTGEEAGKRSFPNDLRPCGSGKKYKNCCGKKPS